MRFLNIKITNINSLKGTHEISFRELAKESDLFAITGPTGSGKSTILHSLCMALYGSHPKGLSAKDIVTMGTAKGRIELEFENASKTYQIIWECQVLKKDGTPRKTPAINRVISDSTGPLEKSTEEILGLSYDQFTKVCILNQGQFSQFLTASFKDRKDLLEKLLEDKNLKELAIALRRSLKEIGSEIEHLKSLSQSTQLLSEDEVKSHQLQFKTLNKEITELSNQTDNLTEITELLTKLLETLQSLLTNQEREKKERESLERIRKEKEIILKEYGPLTKSNNTLKEDYKARLIILEEAIEALQKLTHLEKDISEGQNRLARLKEDIKEQKNLREKTATLINEVTPQKSALEETLKDYKDEDLKRQSEIQQKIDKEESQGQLAKLELGHATGELKRIEDGANKIKEEMAPLQKITASHSLEEIKEDIDNLKKKRDHFQRDALREESLIKEVEDLHKKIKVIKDTIAGDEEEFKLLLKKHQETQENLENLRNQGSLYLFQTQGIELINDEYCPLCEQSHPSLKETLLEKTQTNRYVLEEFKDAEKEEEILKNQSILFKERLQSQENNLKEQIKKKEGTEEELTQVQSRIKGLTQDKIDKEIKEKEDLISSLKEKLSLLTEKQKTLSLQREAWKEASLSVKRSTSKLQEHDCTLAHLKEALPYPNLAPKECANLSEKVSQLLQLKKEEDSLKNSLLESENALNKSEKYFNEEEQKLKELNTQLSALTNLQAHNNHPEEPKKERDQWMERIERSDQDLSNLSRSLQEKEVEYSKKESSLNHLREQREDDLRLTNLYAPKLISQYEAALTAPFNQSLKTSFSKAITYLREELKEGSYPIELLKGLNNDVFLKELGLLKKSLEEKKVEVIVIKTKLDENDKLSQKRLELDKLRNDLEKRYQKLSALTPYIDKDKFRDFALEMMEVQLLKLANAELLSLAEGRYQLLHAKEGKNSELLVLDLWNSGSQRKVSTLSGGETFLLSLGLALGLSELTRGQTQIDSFFIDEGFGTLDDESLGQVLDCLLKMESKGKQIGIISHVTGLTQQIPLRLNLKKNHFGEAQISLN